MSALNWLAVAMSMASIGLSCLSAYWLRQARIGLARRDRIYAEIAALTDSTKGTP